ncbi:MAG: methyl-accepting chemotaxis protein, partial [Fibrobacteria bacterium]
GDAGKGFAVVAEEVRNLAQRSAEAAKNTSSLIEQSQKNADNGVAVSGEVAGILTQIVESVNKLGQLIGEVSSASQEQSKGIEQIGTAVTEMDKLTQSNAANAEESASASEELSAQASELKDMVNVLVGIVSGSTAGNGPAIAVPSARNAGSSRRLSPSKAGKPARPSVPVARKPHPKQDWTPAPANQKTEHAPAFRTAVKSAHAESVIPLGDDELKDF